MQHRPPVSALRIFLIRHAAPAINRKGFFSTAAATGYISRYDLAGLSENAFTRPTGLPKNVKKVYTSTLPRARQTARLLFGPEVALAEDAAFNEFQRKIFRLPLLRFPIWAWLGSARLLWLLGLNNKGIETFKEARQRARKCAWNLSRKAETEGTVILVAHGFLNNFITRELKKLGWKKVRHDGNTFLAVTELQKEPLSPQA